LDIIELEEVRFIIDPPKDPDFYVLANGSVLKLVVTFSE